MSDEIFLFDKPEYLESLSAIRFRLPCPIKGCGWTDHYHQSKYIYGVYPDLQVQIERRMILDARQHLQYDHDLWTRAAAEQEIQIDLRSSGIYYDKHSNRYYGPYPT